MSVDQLPQPKATTRGDAKLVKYDEYIDRQVESTRRVVKFVDLATSLVVLAAGVLAFLLVVAMVEHWLVPGGFSELMRLGLFLLLAWGVASFAFRRLWPLVIGRVNPIYAAHTIELSAADGPSLKNSLVNLLLFRQKRAEISDAVYHTLEEQAAQRLSRVPLDSAVDHTTLIRFGYLLVAIVAIAGLYKVFSPKDPLVTARRVLMPWAHIVPASRVRILDVKPGVVTVSRGEHVDVSAEVRGIGDDDNVLLRFTTADGQAVGKTTPMKLSRGNLRYEGRLPVEGESGSAVGLSQDVTYRIEAGDARTLDYSVKVVDAPSILVERVEYDYPEYTGYLDREEKPGDIKAIEGTRVTVHARANGPIKEAHVDFDADGRRELAMQSRDANAAASFVLALREDRRTPEHASYVLRFTNQDGRANRSPVKHSIVVEPDYAPEAAIVAPREKLLDVRLGDTVAIEVEARDPDFALSSVRLRGQVQGRDKLDVPLLKKNHNGPFSSRYQFKPSEHGLQAGDVVDYWIAANDNRTPQANVAESPRQQFRIISPDPAQQPPPDRIAQRDPPRNPQNGQQGEGQPQDGKNGQGEQQGQKQGQSKDDGESSRDPKGSAEQQKEGEGESGRGGDSNSTAGSENQSDQQQSAQQGQQSDKQSQSAGKNPNDKQTGAGAAGSEPSQDSQPDGARPVANSGAKPSDGEAASAAGKRDRQQGDATQPGQKSPPNADQSPVSSDGDNDGEAFERIQQHMQRTGEMKEDSPAEQQQRGGEGEKGSGGEQPESQQKREQNGVGETDAAAKQQAGEKSEPQSQTQGENQAGQKEAGEQAEGSGADTKGGEPPSAKQQPGDKNEQTKSPGGQETSTKGESGAGDEQKSQGAPNSQPNMKPTEKREQQPSPDGDTNQEEPPAGARGKRESDSQGEQGGDRAGGGEEGGGQKAPRDGAGSAGQNQSADEGGGESGERGAGNNSPNAGSDAVADKQTGQSDGKTPGRGSKTRDVGDVQPKPGEAPEPGQKEGDPLHREPPTSEESQAPQDGEEADRAGGKQSAGADSQRKDAQQNADPSGAPTGEGGQQGTAAMAPPRSTGTAPVGDQANLDYARKQTDFVLEKLSDQMNRKQVDKDLLKKLGWSEDELRKFVDRWRDRKQAAERTDESGDAAKRELDESLRSLGLRRGPLKQGQVKDDTMRDLREGYRGPVPLEYQERLRAYNQGVSRSREQYDSP